jgi:hypothetical protein
MRQLVAKSHQHIFRVGTEDMLATPDLGGHELRECIEMLILCLLCCARMDASSRTSRARSTSSSRNGFRSGAHGVGRPWTAMRAHLLSRLRDDAPLRRRTHYGSSMISRVGLRKSGHGTVQASLSPSSGGILIRDRWSISKVEEGPSPGR